MFGSAIEIVNPASDHFLHSQGCVWRGARGPVRRKSRVIFQRHGWWGTPSSERGEPGGTSGSTHGLGYLITAFRRQRLIADELFLQLTTFLRSLDLFLELIVLTPGTLTANQVWHGGKQGTDNPELSRIHSSACLVLASLPRNLRPKD